jgi:hypothetical protein
MRQSTLLTKLLLGAATLALASTAQAQTTIETDTETQIRTSTAGTNNTADDVTVASGTSVTLTDAGPALVLDSDNDLTLDGAVNLDNVNDATGVELQGGADRNYTQSGSISITEDFDPGNTDDDPFVDGRFAEGSGRTGILISGASPFQGNIDLAASSDISIQGNDSFGINLANTPMMQNGLTGNLTTAGQINLVGDRNVGVNLDAPVIGDLNQLGTVSVRGEDSRGYVIAGDVQGGFANANTISATGYRFTQRLPFGGENSSTGREDLGAEDLLQSGSAIDISASITEGIYLQQRLVQQLDANGDPITDEDGNGQFILASTSTITQLGNAPAVLIDGQGQPIAIGLVAAITDPTDPEFSATQQYAFVNEGTISASGLFDDVDATVLSAADVTFAGGINNIGSMTATTYRAPVENDLAAIGEGVARVIVLGDNAIADQINNSGLIVATAQEAADEIFFDTNNIIPPRALLAVGIDVSSSAQLAEIVNTGAISALLTGREGAAFAIRDASGTLTSISNSGTIIATAGNSDSTGDSETDFNLVAIDVSALTSGFTYTQTQNPDSENAPITNGDILLGSGDDTITSSAGVIVSNVDFGGGDATLALSGGSIFGGEITNVDSLDLSVTEGSIFTIANAEPVTVSNALFDETSTFRPVINGATGGASSLIGTGDITFEAGATVFPILSNIIGTNVVEYTIASADNLTIGDLATLSEGASPFLYDTSLAISASDPNTLVVTLDLRDPGLSVADGGLGLDAVQQAAFGSFVADGAGGRSFDAGPVFEALSTTSAIGDAFANIDNSSEFYAAINQVLPEFGAAAKQFVLANVDGSVGAVGSHLDVARRSPDKPGGAWLQEYFYFADRDLAGLSEQYRGAGFGFTGGIDTAFGPFHAVGINAGFASTEIEDVVGVDEPLDVITYQAGVYAGLESGGFSFDAYGGVGYNEFEQNRRVRVNEFFGTASGEWEGVHLNGTLRAGYDVPLGSKYWMRPTASFDFLSLNETGYTETGTQGVRLRVDGRTSETAAATAMLNFGAEYQGKRTWIRPSLRVGYRNEFMSDPVLTPFRFQGLQGADGVLFDSELAELRSLAFPDEGVLLGFTVAAGSAYSSIGFDFDSDIRDGFIRHTGRIVIRLLF